MAFGFQGSKWVAQPQSENESLITEYESEMAPDSLKM